LWLCDWVEQIAGKRPQLGQLLYTPGLVCKERIL